MQQVAASTKDIAAPGLFPGDPVTSDVTGAGADFAKVMESHSADSGEQGYRGHGDFFDAPENLHKKEVSLEEGATSGAKIGDGFSDNALQPNPDQTVMDSAEQAKSGDGKAQADQDEMHEEWISIIQKLNSDEKPYGDGKVTPTIPVDDQGKMISSLPGTGEAETDDFDQELLAQEEVLVEETDVTDSVQWKEELKQKLLNSGQQLNSQQIKALDIDINNMSDADIQQLLNDDQALKKMLSDIMNAQEPDPQDVALLMALAGEGPGAELNTGDTDVVIDGNTDVVIDSDFASEPETPFEGGDAETGNEASDELRNSLNEQIVTDAAIEEGEKQPLSTASTQQQSNTEVNENAAKEPQTDIEKLLNQLDSSVKTDEQKVATLENLTRRVESSELAQTPAGKSFVETMKDATAEFKEQLKAGHEPAINLNKLVTEAVHAESGKAEATALESQIRGAVHKMVDVAQTHLSLEPGTRESLVSSFQNTLNNRESSAAHLEAGKTQQQNLQNQLMDKAVNINKPEAAQDLANKVQVMMNQKNMVADIRLDPPDLGQMQIKISMQGDSASVSMVVQSQAAREALEHNEPHLKELLEQQGIELGQSSVQQESRGNKGEGDGSNFASGKGAEAADELGGDAENEQVVTVAEPDGIDYFA